jgi:hypothetical protein
MGKMIYSEKCRRCGISVMSIISVVLLMSCSSRTDLQKWGLNGKVKSCTEKVHQVEEKFGKFDAGDIDYYGNHCRIGFDEKGAYTEIEYLDPEENVFGKLIPKRENGVVIEEGFYDEDGKLLNNTKNNFISEDEADFESFDETGKKTASGKTISKNGNAVKQTYYFYNGDDAGEELIMTFEYDKDGNRIEQKQVDNTGKVLYSAKFEYLEFDEQKNWIKMLTYRDGEPASVTVRKIEYY